MKPRATTMRHHSLAESLLAVMRLGSPRALIPSAERAMVRIAA